MSELRNDKRASRLSSLRVALVCGMLFPVMARDVPEAAEREPVTLRVVAVNPSAEKKQVVPVRIELPQEVTPQDILDRGNLDLEYDDDHALYYVYKQDVELAPKETKIFQVTVKDVWFVPEVQLDLLKEQTNRLLARLAGSEYAEAGNKLAQSILERIDGIAGVQADETLSRKSRIGAYRKNLQILAEVREDLARLEKLLTFAGGPPVPEMLEESPLKSDAPSTTTTWLVIFLIVIFMGLLAGQFFFTWQRRVKSAADFSQSQQAAFPKPEATSGGQ